MVISSPISWTTQATAIKRAAVTQERVGGEGDGGAGGGGG
jgi:hypothetical protein